MASFAVASAPVEADVNIHILHCGSWFNAQVAALKEHVALKFPGASINFTNTPVEVPKGEGKPFEITINDKLVWSMFEKVADQPLQKKPIQLTTNKWWGEPDAAAIAFFESSVAAAFIN